MDGTTTLFIVAKHGHVPVVTQLIEVRCNVNLARTDGVTPLLMMTATGHRSVVKKLITAHCDVNLRCGYDSQNATSAFPMVSRSPCPPNLCPCLCTVHPIKYHSVSFSDVFIGEICTFSPTLMYTLSTSQQIFIFSSIMMGPNLPNLQFSIISSKITHATINSGPRIWSQTELSIAGSTSTVHSGHMSNEWGGMFIWLLFAVYLLNI
jgi:hypothetical protein